MRQIEPVSTPLMRSGVPLYRQLANVIRAMAAEGGTLAFTEEQLCRRFQVSRTTVRQALQRLESDGLVARQQGKGTTVISPREADPFPLWVFGTIDDIFAYGHETAYELLEREVVRAPREVADALGIPADAHCYRFLGVRAAKGRPFTEIETWLPYQVGIQVLPHIKDGISPIMALGEDGIGARLEEVQQTFSAALATKAVGARVGLKRGQPMLVIRRLYADAGGNPIGLSINYCNPERFQYRTRLQKRSRP